MNDRPLQRNYARIERERRFLLTRLPDPVRAEEFERLFDLYIEGTNLRLRRMERPDGEPLIVKLGQKLPDPDAPGDPRRRQMTTLYLKDSEAKLFATLPGRRSVKRRYKLPEQGWTFVIDQYEYPPSSAGLIICEVECDTDEQLAAICIPAWASREVTADGQYSGVELAFK